MSGEKPLYVPDLLVNDIRKEHTARKIDVDTKQPRDVLQKTLQEILQGGQRVPPHTAVASSWKKVEGY